MLKTEVGEVMLKFFSKAAPAMVLAALCLGHPIHAQDTVTAPLDATTPSSSSGIEDINKALEALSQELLLSLPPAGTYAIQSLNDATSGVPEALLTQISSSLSSSLMVASNFEINLIDQSQQNSAWANAVEFNGADFEAMVAASDFSAMIVLKTRATNTGIEISLQAIGATSADAGQVLASTQVKMVQLNWAEFASADLTDKTAKKIEDIQAQLEKLKSSNEPIQDATEFAEFLHNAELYKASGDVENTISNLESAIKLDPTFVDIVTDLTQFLVQKYGSENARKYLEKRLQSYLSDGMFKYALLVIDPNFDDGVFAYLMDDPNYYDGLNDYYEKTVFPPLAAKWLWGAGKQAMVQRNPSSPQYNVDFVLLQSARLVIRSFQSGEFQTHFLNKLRAAEIANLDEAKALEKDLNRVEYSVFKIEYQRGSDAPHFPSDPNFKLYSFYPSVATDQITGGDDFLDENQNIVNLNGIAELIITDEVDITKPILIRFLSDEGAPDYPGPSIIDISKDGTVFNEGGLPVNLTKPEGNYENTIGNNRWLWASGIVQSLIGHRYIYSVEYTDLNGQSRFVENTYVYAAPEYAAENYLLSEKIKLIEGGFSYDGSTDWTYERNGVIGFSPSGDGASQQNASPQSNENSSGLGDFSSLGTCVNDVGSVFYPTNIDEYVSLRSDPATDANILKKVFKGEKLERADRTVYTGLNSPTQNQCYELCMAESETGRINTSNLAICVNDNSLWLKLRTSDGVEGYISTKFLGVPTSDFSSSEGGAYEEGD